ncbi:SDR family oxidoreductase [Paractinoplanes brasiliensis]|uniref:NADP-dependent 3-hydroxy acid dehydrogenase YdfG n=1 Tax=Paractinoplanes brasiliensis TaxID=52695 RepID=A0A4V3C7B3_9ACTN|nr:SDR family oxidoreductase [Actinoplanes brasiliensis]TDO37018.1 NADP-dependent 3-hydroxy acid dehydrogenase YdfG [Actinoplanes brasiliensis]GID30541.1 short-chain dehydrogenase/reductase [Actinoplanes brasiliensis]
MTSRNWLITGVTSGFGRHLSEQLLSRGDRVAGTFRTAAGVDEISASWPDTFHPARLDVTDPAGIVTVVDRAFAALGRIDVVVSNAGYGLMGAAEELSDEQIVHQIATNLTGSIRFIRATLPHLRRQGGGRILQLSSVGGQAAWPGGSLYHATKWGIEGFADALAGEVAPFGIGVTIVEPGGARTNFRYGGSVLAERIEAYDATPAAHIRRILTERTTQGIGDPARMAAAMIDSADREPAPRRLVLGSDAYQGIETALAARLADIRAQRESAAATDAPLPGTATGGVAELRTAPTRL